MSASDVLKIMKEKNVKFVDLRFTDTKGKEQHVTIPSEYVNEHEPFTTAGTTVCEFAQTALRFC